VLGPSNVLLTKKNQPSKALLELTFFPKFVTHTYGKENTMHLDILKLFIHELKVLYIYGSKVSSIYA
jgi:hypothetical protein